MLEAGRIRGIAGDGNIHAFMMHDGNTFSYIIGTVTVHGCTLPCRICGPGNFFQFPAEVIKLRFHISKAVDAGYDLGSIFAQSV